MKHILEIPEMSCSHCKKRISEVLVSKYINDFKINLENKQITLYSDYTADTLTELLREAGYESHIIS